MTDVSATPERQPIDGLTKVAVILSMLAFVIPFVAAIASFALAILAKARLRRSGGDRMNEGLCTLAQVTAFFTLALYGGFLWYAKYTWG